MGAIKIPPPPVGFGGIVPRTAARLLQENAAQVAVNCWVSSGELIPMRSGVLRYTSANTGPFASIHRIAENGSEAWLSWAVDVDVVKAPLFGTARWCFTGDGEPRITTLADATAGAGDDYPNTAYTLGVPTPVTAPMVTPSGGVGSTVERYYRYAFYSVWDDVELENAASPVSAVASGKVDGTWDISDMDATPPNSGTVSGVYGSGETEFTDTVEHWLRVGEQIVIGGDTVSVTEITSTLIFKVAGDYSAETAWERKAHFAGTIKRRLYRTTGTLGQWQLVADGITATTYSDTLTDAQIPGDELISATWEMPPVGLRGLFMLPSGAVGGFIGNQLRFSEPNQPQAWPPEYAMQADYDIVAAGCFGSGIVAATGSRPFMVQGVTPGQMSGESWEEALPCVAKRSAVSLGDAVLYASNPGMVVAGPAGVSIWSAPYFTEAEWRDINPTSMVSCVAGRRVFVRYDVDGNQRTLVFSLMDQAHLVEAHFRSDELHGDAEDGRMYYSVDSKIYEFDVAAAYPLSQDWMSKEIILPAQRNLGAGRVEFFEAIDPDVAAAIEARIAEIEAANALAIATGDVHGAWADYGFVSGHGYAGSDVDVVPEAPPSNSVVFMLYINGLLKAARTITTRKPFSLPSGYKARRVAVRVSSQCRIIALELGGTKQELASI